MASFGCFVKYTSKFIIYKVFTFIFCIAIVTHIPHGAELRGLNMIGTKEHYDVIEFFETKGLPHGRNDKEPKELWLKGQIYQDGKRNNEFQMFFAGYMLGRLNYMNQ